jgi:hypothetical protein
MMARALELYGLPRGEAASALLISLVSSYVPAGVSTVLAVCLPAAAAVWWLAAREFDRFDAYFAERPAGSGQ